MENTKMLTNEELAKELAKMTPAELFAAALARETNKKSEA